MKTSAVMRNPRLNDQQAHTFLEALFEEDLHAKRVLSLEVIPGVNYADTGGHAPLLLTCLGARTALWVAMCYTLLVLWSWTWLWTSL